MKKKYSEKEELYFSFLEDLRDSGATNMFGAGSYLEEEFGLEPKEAGDVLVKWMKSFNDESSDDEDNEKSNSCSVDLSPSDNKVYAYHVKDKKYYRVARYTDKRVYFLEEHKQFAPKTSIEKYLVKDSE